MNEDSRSAGSKADFLRLAGIGPELVEFVIDFMEKPEIFFSMSFERRREIENQMDAILSSFHGEGCVDRNIRKLKRDPSTKPPGTFSRFSGNSPGKMSDLPMDRRPQGKNNIDQ